MEEMLAMEDSCTITLVPGETLKTTEDHSGADVHPEKKPRGSVTKALLTSVSEDAQQPCSQGASALSRSEL